MGHTEKRSIAEFYRDYETTIENHIGNPDSEIFDGVRAILIGNKIKLGQAVTEQERLYWEQWERKNE